MVTVSEILLRRKNKLTVERRDVDVSTADKRVVSMVIAIAKNAEAYGYSLSNEVINALNGYTEVEIKEFYNSFIRIIRTLVSADVNYRPMYPNFPDQVASMSDAELFVNAFVHYCTYGQWLPSYEKSERMPLTDTNKMTVLSIGTSSDIMEIFCNIVGSKTSISNQDKADVEEILKSYPQCADMLPDEIPMKENVAFISKLVMKLYPNGIDYIGKYYKTATDVLRLVTALSDGDVSLSERTMYRHLRRPERRMIMDLLSNCTNILEDMYRNLSEWIRIGEIIHPFTYRDSKYTEVNKAFYTLRNQKKPLMFAGKVETSIQRGETEVAASLLKSRPGEFARRLDKLLRDTSENYGIVNAFSSIADKVSTPVLLQVRQHFVNRELDSIGNVRVFFPKGNVAKAISTPNHLPDIDSNVCKSIVHICEMALMKNYSLRPQLGKVYVDRDMVNYLVPFSQRSASAGNKILVRGSRVKVQQETKIIRAFIWWTNTNKRMPETFGDNNRVDIDLSAVILDDKLNYVNHVSYTRLKDDNCRAYHSGDITNGGSPDGKGVAEFIDIDIDAIAKLGRYVCFNVYNYTMQKYAELDNCRFGWMRRDGMGTGEIFEPSTVDMAIKLTAQSNVSIPVIFDCVNREFIWMDMNIGTDGFGRTRFGGNNVESNMAGVQATCYALLNTKKPNLYGLIMLNALARGTMVYDRNDADIIFSNDTTKPRVMETSGENEVTSDDVNKDVQIITAYDIDYYMCNMI